VSSNAIHNANWTQWACKNNAFSRLFQCEVNLFAGIYRTTYRTYILKLFWKAKCPLSLQLQLEKLIIIKNNTNSDLI
jgi:hypothetical protein